MVSSLVLSAQIGRSEGEDSGNTELYSLRAHSYHYSYRRFEQEEEFSTFVVNITANILPHMNLDSLDMRESIALHSLSVAIFHDQMDVFSDPNSAEMIGRVLDCENVSFEEAFSWINDSEDLRSLLRIARARLLRETVGGVTPEPAALQIAKRILDSTGV